MASSDVISSTISVEKVLPLLYGIFYKWFINMYLTVTQQFIQWSGNTKKNIE